MFSDRSSKGTIRGWSMAPSVSFAVSAETVRVLATAAVDQALRKAALVSNDTDLSMHYAHVPGTASPPAKSPCTQHAGSSPVAGRVNRVLIPATGYFGVTRGCSSHCARWSLNYYM